MGVKSRLEILIQGNEHETLGERKHLSLALFIIIIFFFLV